MKNYNLGFSLIILLISISAICLLSFFATKILFNNNISTQSQTKSEPSPVINNQISRNMDECQITENLSPLFEEFNDPTKAPPSPDKFTLRSRIVKINKSAFQIEATDSGRQISGAQKILLNPFPNVCAVAELDRTIPFQLGTGFTWSGHVGSKEPGSVIFGVSEEAFVGSFWIGQRSFRVEPPKNGVYAISEIDWRIPIEQ